jgi:PEP-CTERM motif
LKRPLLALFFLVLFAGVALADTELLQNGGFESGALSPWYNARDFCNNGTCSSWAVTNSNPHNGTYSAMDIGNFEMRQDFTPTPGSQITDVSFWIYTSAPASAFDFFYTDSSDEEFVVFAPQNTWTLETVTADVNAGKTLSGFSIWGSSPSITTYVDDASITATPEPSTLVLLGGSALALCGNLRRRMRG